MLTKGHHYAVLVICMNRLVHTETKRITYASLIYAFRRHAISHIRMIYGSEKISRQPTGRMFGYGVHRQ